MRATRKQQRKQMPKLADRELPDDAWTWERVHEDWEGFLEEHPEAEERLHRARRMASRLIQSVFREWPDPEGYEPMPLKQAEREVEARCRRVVEEHPEDEARRILRERERDLAEAIEKARDVAEDANAMAVNRKSARAFKNHFSLNLRVIRRFRRGARLEAPDLSKQDVTGSRAPAYVLEARDVLKDNPAVSTFKKLAGKIGEPTVNGNSKVKTLKRVTGYADLPKAEKGFPRFKEMLLAEAAKLEG